MAKDDRASEFIFALTIVIGLLAIIYGFYLMSLNVIDWGIFLTVIGFIVALFMSYVFLRPRK